MDHLTQDDTRSHGPLRGAGPIVFAFSLVGAALLWSRYRTPGYGLGERMHSAPALPDHAGVEGWAGTFGALHARLMPLHADPARQHFDAQALAKRLDLEPGEPWRLVVTYLPRGATASAPVSLQGWTVVDDGGLALRAIVTGQEPESSMVDPLRSLLGCPDELEPGQEVSLVLWGRAPSGSAPTGNAPTGNARAGSAQAGPRILGASEPALDKDQVWKLEARRFDRFASQPSLARLDLGHAMPEGSRNPAAATGGASVPR